MSEVIKGYKVFNPDWTCKNNFQYACPGVFKEDVTPSAGYRGLHFCRNIIECYEYYAFIPENKVAEVVALDDVDLKSGSSLVCTNRIQIVRELSWEEVLQLVNIGGGCTGKGNVGDFNSGDRNTGKMNSGNSNTGGYNIGNWNSGHLNSGNSNVGRVNSGWYNVGDRNSGSRNVGCKNTGNWNTGDKNTGSRNTGELNSGNWNAGSSNSGNSNTGSWNIGDGNTGDWNVASFSTGCFMTEELKISMFNKPSDWSYRNWMESEARHILRGMPVKSTLWVYFGDMTDEEKTEHPDAEAMGGYLKKRDEDITRQEWWNNLTEKQKNAVMRLPNFDPEIFRQCTGIVVDN